MSETITKKQRPNIILLSVDDVGWSDITHESNFPTPNIQKLQREGVELDRMYVMPVCSPTRSAFMTGRFPWKTGLQHINTIMPGSKAGIPPETPTMPEILRDVGYSTHMIGKWHLGAYHKSQTPAQRGFESYLGYNQGQTDYFNHTVPTCGIQACVYRQNCKDNLPNSNGGCDHPEESPYGPQADAVDFWEDNNPLVNVSGVYSQEIYTQRMRDIIQKHSTSTDDKPLFVYYSSQLLHLPLEFPTDPKHQEACKHIKDIDQQSPVKRSTLCTMASALDEAVGDMIESLKKYNMYDNTLIWFVSDNGGMVKYQDNFPASASTNWPLRGSKTTLFEGGLRVASFVAGGDKVIPINIRGSKRTNLMHAVDILPTLMKLGGVTAENHELDGMDLWPVISDSSSNTRTELPLVINNNKELVGHFLNPDQANYSALIMWPWKIIVGSATFIPNPILKGWFDVEDYKFFPAPAEESWEAGALLFNLETDPTEHYNVAAHFPEIVHNLTDRVQNWWLKPENGYVQSQPNLPVPKANPLYHDWIWGTQD